MDDSSWKQVVYGLASNSPFQTGLLLKAESYLWSSPDTFRRLDKEAHAYTRFMCELVTKCPDLILRALYRKAVIEDYKKSE